jgi:hypothetical protein
MSPRITLPATLAILVLTASAQAQTVYYPDRPIVVPMGTGETTVDLTVDLDRGNAGEVFGVGSGLAGDRTPGLSVRAGLLRNFEIGFSLQFLYGLHDGDDYSTPAVDSDGDGIPDSPARNAGSEGDGTRRIAGWPYALGPGSSHLVPLYIYGRYAFLPQLGAELGVIIPIDQRLGLNRPALRLGIPFQYILSPGMLSIHARPDVILGFASPDGGPAGGLDELLVSVYVDAGFTFALVGFYLDVTVAYGGDVSRYKKGVLPFTILMGYTVLPELDVYAGFTLTDMIPSRGKPGDARSLTVGFNVRY